MLGKKSDERSGNERDSEFGIRNAELENDGSSECEIRNSESDEEGAAVSVEKTGKRTIGKKGAASRNAAGEQGAEGEAGKIADEPGARSADEPPADPAEVLQEELKAERDKYLRLAAEYDNYRKRSGKERESIYNDARADTITRLLPVYDNLERALKMECSDEAYYKGVEMTMTQLTELLEGMGVRPITAVGEPFDPNRHNAVMSVENPELGEKIVSEEFQKGFLLGERVIRFSTVVVAN